MPAFTPLAANSGGTDGSSQGGSSVAVGLTQKNRKGEGSTMAKRRASRSAGTFRACVKSKTKGVRGGGRTGARRRLASASRECAKQR